MLKNKKFEFSSKKPKIISLVGMMGSGKTKFGKFLSKKFKYHFYDIDMKIQHLFVLWDVLITGGIGQLIIIQLI